MFRTVGDQVSLWEAVLPPEVLKLPVELSRVDELLDDEVFFAPFLPFFSVTHGRPSTPMEVYLRLMFPKFRHGLGYESLCREVADGPRRVGGWSGRCVAAERVERGGLDLRSPGVRGPGRHWPSTVPDRPLVTSSSRAVRPANRSATPVAY